MSDNYTWPRKCPDLTQDVSLKRARLDVSTDQSAILVSDIGGGTDLTPVTDALGDTADTSSDDTVIGLLKRINERF